MIVGGHGLPIYAKPVVIRDYVKTPPMLAPHEKKPCHKNLWHDAHSSNNRIESNMQADKFSHVVNTLSHKRRWVALIFAAVLIILMVLFWMWQDSPQIAGPGVDSDEAKTVVISGGYELFIHGKPVVIQGEDPCLHDAAADCEVIKTTTLKVEVAVSGIGGDGPTHETWAVSRDKSHTVLERHGEPDKQ